MADLASLGPIWSNLAGATAGGIAGGIGQDLFPAPARDALDRRRSDARSPLAPTWPCRYNTRRAGTTCSPGKVWMSICAPFPDSRDRDGKVRNVVRRRNRPASFSECSVPDLAASTVYPGLPHSCRDGLVSAGESSDDNLRLPDSALRALHEVPIDAFEAQCTEALLKRLRRYALLHARLPGGEHLGDAAAHAEEVVQAAATDVLAGVLRWDPAERQLESLLLDVVRLRIRRDRRRAARHPHVSIDATRSDRPPTSAGATEAHLVSHGALGWRSESGLAAGKLGVMQLLRERLEGDLLASRFLAAIDQGASKRAEIMRAAQLSRTEYYSTRRRLARLLAQIETGERSPSREN